MQITRIVLATALTLAVLLLCGSPSLIQAQSDTKIVIGDGGSLLLRPDGLDGNQTWNSSATEIKHQNLNGVLTGLQITDGGTNRCGSSATCGIDPTQSWWIRLTYGKGSLTISSLSANKGVHITEKKLPFNTWKSTGNPDEREFGHGDGNHISSIKVTGNGNNLCSGHGCQITVTYSPK